MSEADSDVYIPGPTSAVPGTIARSKQRGNNFRGSGGRGNEGWRGGYSGGFAGRATDERMRPVVDPYRIMPYEGT
jgi:hypothetical protein